MSESALWIMAIPIFAVLGIALQLASFFIFAKLGEIKAFTFAHIFSLASLSCMIYFIAKERSIDDVLGWPFILVAASPHVYAYAIGRRSNDDPEFKERIRPILHRIFGILVNASERQIKKYRRTSVIIGGTTGLIIGITTYGAVIKVIGFSIAGAMIGLVAFTYYLFLAGSAHGN